MAGRSPEKVGPKHFQYLGRRSSAIGFDCSGLVHAAYQAACVRLPRVAQD